MIKKLIGKSNYPLVSVIIPNWNRKKMLRECLKSIKKQKYPNFEIIVVDNASTDGSPEMVEREFPDIRVIRNEKNLGFAGGCNTGIKSAKGKLIAILNNDTVVDASWLTELVNLILQSPEIGVVGSIILHYKPNEIVWSAGGRIDAITGVDWRIAFGKRSDEVDSVIDADYICGCALLIKKEVIEKIGLLSEDYFMYLEDVEWSLCARRIGYKCKVSSSSIVWHKVPFKKDTRLTAHSFYTRGIFRLYFEHFPLRYLLTTLFFQIIVIPIFEILLFRVPSSSLINRYKGLCESLRELRKIMLERKKNELRGRPIVKNRFRECLVIAKEAKALGRRPLA